MSALTAASCIKPRMAKCARRKPITFLADQVGGLTAQDHLGPAQMRLQFVQRGFDLPAFVIERGEFRRRGRGRILNRGNEAIERLGVGHARQRVVDHPHPRAVAPLAARLDRVARDKYVLQYDPSGQRRLARQPGVAVSGATPSRRPSRERPARGPSQKTGGRPDTACPAAGPARTCPAPTCFTRRDTHPHGGAEQHVRAVLDQRHDPQLGGYALVPRGVPGRPERPLVLPRIGHVERRAVQAHEPPRVIPRPPRGRAGNRARPVRGPGF